MLDVDAVAESFSNFGRTIATTLNGVIDLFSNLWENIKKYIPIELYNKRVSRKRFVKLLMSYKIQRNEANKIANEIHKQNGEYRLSDICKYIGGNNE